MKLNTRADLEDIKDCKNQLGCLKAAGIIDPEAHCRISLPRMLRILRPYKKSSNSWCNAAMRVLEVWKSEDGEIAKLSWGMVGATAYLLDVGRFLDEGEKE